MNRRGFTRMLGAGLIASASLPRLAFASASAPEVSITMDDFNLIDPDPARAEQRTRDILAALEAHSIKSVMFVAGKNIDSPLGARLLKLWSDAGHLIANHTYSHRNYANSDFAEYTADFLRCDALIKTYPQYRKLFRFPYLKEGDTAEHRDRMRAFLAEQGYRNGAVTIDASDWYVDRRLRARLETDPKADTRGFRDFYLQHILDRSKFYDEVSRKGLGRSVRHTLLVHHNVVNGMFLGDVLTQYKKNGWKLIDAGHAYEDPVFREQPGILPAGDSLVLALAIERGKMQRPRWPSEDGDYEKPAMDKLGL